MGKALDSDWMAVPSTPNPAPTIRPASSAYQIFQRDTAPFLKREFQSQKRLFDVDTLTREVSNRWHNLEDDRREVYEKLARDDNARFLQETGDRDGDAAERQEVSSKESDEIPEDVGGRRTRSGVDGGHSGMTGVGSKEMNGVEEDEEEDEDSVESFPSEKDNDDDYGEEEESSSSSGGEEADSDKDEYKEDDDDDDDDDDDSSSKMSSSSSDSSDFGAPRRRKAKAKPKSKPKPKPKPKPKKSSPPLRPKPNPRASPPVGRNARLHAQREIKKSTNMDKDEREQYIQQKHEDLRKDRASQAKRRLEFLLKQSDIFAHFGNVKEDQTKLLANRRSTRSTAALDAEGDGTGTLRREGGPAEEEEQGEPDEEIVTTYLTTQPSTISFGKMRDYQLEGLNWMLHLQENGVNGILADEMGLGKTLQSISVLVYMLEYRNHTGPHLVVVPKSTLSNWMNEMARWAPTLRVIKFHGTKDERNTIATSILQPGQRDEFRDWNVCLTTYEVCNSDRNVLNKFAWCYLMIDEAHRLKNEASAFSKTVRTFETRYRLLLTGTPLQNNLHELWALLNFLVPDVFANSEQFDDWFNLDIDDDEAKNNLISQLHKILRPFMLRRLKADVEKSLPPKHETILFTGMSVMQKKLYKDILMRDIDVLQGKKNTSGAGSRTAVLNIVMQLRKCSGHPYLFPGVEDRTLPPLGEHIVINCGKMVLLDKLLKRLNERGHRVLLFTQMTRLMDILEDYLVMRHYPYCRIDGNTSYDVREESIDTFNAPNSNKFLFLLSTRAGGLGINLQTADVVILYDSDWNPQADLQAQDRAHRIGQRREVQVFRLVTEHSIEEKVVERAQQKLKLDAMVVQQGRLKDKDKMSGQDLLEAVRFGADKVFKSKDSSITDDDIDMILNLGKKKTQELNDKIQNSDKGDMLDFKLDGGSISAQTWEGVDYSKMGKSGSAKEIEAQKQAEFLSMLDIGKRERNRVQNYNVDQMYRRQIGGSASAGSSKTRRKKKMQLPKYLRLPRMDEWQLFHRDALNSLQEEEEKTYVEFITLHKQMKHADAEGPDGTMTKTVDETTDEAIDETTNKAIDETIDETTNKTITKTSSSINPDTIPPLLSDAKQEEKKKLLSEGFADWGRHHYSAFIRASAKFGRTNHSKIALEVGKPTSAIQDYVTAFWDPTVGKARISENEYDRVLKLVEKGEKKIDDKENLQRGAKILISLFDNPWRELEFTHVNCKDKMFTMEEDRYLLCWTHKLGYGQWDAIQFAIRRSEAFRFDYFMKSLSAESIGRRCEQLMRAAEKEVDHLLREAKEEQGLPADDDTVEVKLPMYKEVRAKKRAKAEKEYDIVRQDLQANVEDVENQIEQIQNRLKLINEHIGVHRNNSHNDFSTASHEFPESLLPELVNMVAKSGFMGIMTIAGKFVEQYPGRVSKRQVSIKIDQVARKEKREDEGDTRPSWYILPDYTHLLDVETLRYLRGANDEDGDDNRKKNGQDVKRKRSVGGDDDDPPLFPEYDGGEPPKEHKKAFTHFCLHTRKDVKSSLDSKKRKDKDHINSILKERWYSLSDTDMKVWKKWEHWDQKRHDREMKIYQQKKLGQGNSSSTGHEDSTVASSDNVPKSMSIPKKKRSIDASHVSQGQNSPTGGDSRYRGNSFSSIPKKRWSNS